MESRTSGRKPDRRIFHLWESLINAGAQVWIILIGRGSVIAVICLFWDLTPVHWAPQNWTWTLRWIHVGAFGSGYLDVDILLSNTPSQCLSYVEKEASVQSDAGVVSGWYGPGAYLAWIFTLYVYSLSSIWNADYSNSDDALREHERPDDGAIDGEFLAVLAYPIVAILDMLYRFIRCKVDPTLDAAMLVVVTSTFTMGIARRLASPPDLDRWTSDQYLPSGLKQWMLSIFLMVGHSLILETAAEPYVSGRFTLILYTLLALNTMHSCIKVEKLMDRYPYRVDEKRPRVERLAVFVLLQAAFLSSLGITWKSILPRTGASLLDLDQCATLVTVVVATIFARRTSVLDWVKEMRLRFAGFARVPSHSVELSDLSAAL